ncbi:CaiB/BaiF CoA transferase family protein [Massilia cavernae]|uniref:CoA transferase n=1 Tax=Massilia cavernae TaxID=2320864 RepID=A0A418X741_9BURK|nr:CaiB/BaiF CoA-transferase family protein [Massilia cavernae]RJG08271.1 CoA transferase [Massilia cavernae]
MTASQGPLKGLKIVELAGLGPGPYCGMLLADLGAEVVQIDRPMGATAVYGIEPSRNILNRGRRSVVLDLKDPVARDQALALIDRADGLIEGNRPGVAERLGLGPDHCLARNPRLVYGRVTGWGQTGPMAQWAGHDLNYIALAGALHVCGRAGERPAIPQNFVGDMGGGGLLLAFGMVSALFEALRSGKGQVVDAAMIEGAASQLSGVLTMQAMGSFEGGRGTHIADGGAHFYEVYDTADGKYIAVGAIEPQFYAAFRRDAGLTDPQFDAQMDQARWPDLKARVARRIAEKTRDEWVAIFSSEACVAPVLSLSEVENYPHNAAREVFLREGGVLQPSPVPKFSRTPGAVACPPPARGADTDAVFRDWGIVRR